MLALLLIINGAQQPLHSFTYDRTAHVARANGIEIPASALRSITWSAGVIRIDHDVLFRNTFEVSP